MNRLFKALLKYYVVVAALIFFCGQFFISCKERTKPTEKVMVQAPEKMDEKVEELIQNFLDYSESKDGKLDDSTILYQLPILAELYKEKSYTPQWSSSENWLKQGDSLLLFIENAKYYGLFPSDYHSSQLRFLKTKFSQAKEADTKDASSWARADLMLSDALISMIHDIKLGRLPNDSITLRKDSVLTEEFISSKFNAAASGLSLDIIIPPLEPKHEGYRDLKTAVKNFLSTADFKPISPIVFPNKNRDELRQAVIKRLFDIHFIDSTSLNADSSQLVLFLKKLQKERGMTIDGKIGAQTIRMLNLSDEEKFKRIAITMDRYKMLPDSMPEKYIWVNIPSYTLRLINKDTMVIKSKVVVGKPLTRTPVLTSAVSEMITYPQWTIPASIIEKEILPGLKRDTAYLRKKGYSLLNSKNEELRADSINWFKYKKTIPFKVIQGSGDDNALGVLKFNFNNKYSVYMHDTNQRSFFGMDSRALSHGCVRVQEWERMAMYILNNDSTYLADKKIKPLPKDSLTHWLAIKEKHSIPVKAKIPVFIRYFTCEAHNGQIDFFEDIYGEDKKMIDLLFANKKNIE